LKVFGARAIGWTPHEKRKKMQRFRHQTVVGIYLGNVYESGEAMLYSRKTGVTAHSKVEVFEEELIERDLLGALSAVVVAEAWKNKNLEVMDIGG
jgi:hypothetical protein